MEAKHHALGILGVKAIAHQIGPQTARRAEFGDLLQQIVLSREEESQPGREFINL